MPPDPAPERLLECFELYPHHRQTSPYLTTVLSRLLLLEHNQACGGATIVYVSLFLFSALAVCVYGGSTEGYVASSCLLLLIILYMM